MIVTQSVEESELLAGTAQTLLEKAGGVGRARQLRDSPERYSADLWARMAELGWPGIAIPSAYGGAGLSAATMLPIFEAMGKTLAPEPLLSAVLASELLRLAGSPDQRNEWLPSICNGEAVVAVAGAHRPRGAHVSADTLRSMTDDGTLTVDGRATHVADATIASAILVVAPEPSPALVVVPAAAPGVRIERQELIDSRNWATVEFDQVRLPHEALMSGSEALVTCLETALDAATLALCAEMLGAMWEVFDRTLAYVKARVQFGHPVGSFQAIQHRLGRLYSELLVTDAAVRGAAGAAQSGDVETPALVSAAKVRCGSTARLVAKEGVQLHGGIGVTDECDIGLFVKRLRLAEFVFGDETWHAERWASCRGY